jgi:hypothetical protein
MHDDVVRTEACAGPVTSPHFTTLEHDGGTGFV